MTISTYLWVITLFLIIYACFVNFLGLNFLILINVPCLSHARVSRLSSAFLHVACELFSICVFHLSNREFGDVSFTATLVGFISSAITYSRTYNTGFCLLIPYHNEQRIHFRKYLHQVFSLGLVFSFGLLVVVGHFG